MKKLFLTMATIFSFGIYSLARRSPTPAVSPQSISNNNNQTAASGTYKDGSYTGKVADAFYGNIQVRTTISGGKITNVEFLQYPNDRGHSILINTMAMPVLKSEAISAQNASVDIVTGATDTSNAFIESLGNTLQQAAI